MRGLFFPSTFSPRILVIHLVRFRTARDHETGTLEIRKTHDHVAFTDSLQHRHSPAYTLRAVLVHNGAYGSGHYFAYVRSLRNDWFLCNDSVVSQRIVDVQRVFSAQAYMLFYEC